MWHYFISIVGTINHCYIYIYIFIWTCLGKFVLGCYCRWDFAPKFPPCFQGVCFWVWKLIFFKCYVKFLFSLIVGFVFLFSLHAYMTLSLFLYKTHIIFVDTLYQQKWRRRNKVFRWKNREKEERNHGIFGVPSLSEGF